MRSCISVLLTKYYSGGHIDHIEKNEVDGTCSTYGKRGGVYRVLVWKPDGKRLLGRSSLRWEDNPKMDLKDAVAYPGILFGGGFNKFS
jgi:hypothetical protein